MKVLQVIDKLDVGGSEKVLVNTANIFKEHEHDISVLCLLSSSVLDEQLHASIPKLYLNRGFKYNLIKLAKLYAILNKYDVVHVHCRHVMRYVGLLLFLPQFLIRFKVVFHDHYGKIEDDKTIDALLKKQLCYINAYVGVSNELVKWFKSINNNVKSHLLSNIVRNNKTAIPMDIEEESINLVAIGNFRKQKNYEFALQVLSVLPQKYTLTIIGGIVEREYYTDIIKLATKLNLTSRLKIEHTITDVTAELVKYHLAIHTASSETGPLVAIEYLAAQLPFVMFNTGEVAQQIQPELSDFIMEDDNVLLWKDKINHIQLHKHKYRSKINSIFQQNFSEENYYHKCLTIYQNL